MTEAGVNELLFSKCKNKVDFTELIEMEIATCLMHFQKELVQLAGNVWSEMVVWVKSIVFPCVHTVTVINKA